MAAPIVQIDHDSMAQIAGVFDRTASDVCQSIQQVYRHVEVLRAGGWVGTGATAFYCEMDEQVMPSMKRLAAALEDASQATRRISQIFLEAEQQAAAALAPDVAGAGLVLLAEFRAERVDDPGASGVPRGPIRDAVAALAKSPHAVDRNTARQLAEGKVKAYYMEDLKPPAANEAKLKKAGLDPKIYTYYVEPGTGKDMLVNKNIAGFSSGTAIFVKRSQSLRKMAGTLIHETNHVLNPKDGKDSIGRYRSEFRAHWVEEYRNISDLNKRAAAIKEDVMNGYPHIKEAYKNNPAVKKAIDGHTRPDGDLTNKGTLK